MKIEIGKSITKAKADNLENLVKLSKMKSEKCDICNLLFVYFSETYCYIVRIIKENMPYFTEELVLNPYRTVCTHCEEKLDKLDITSEQKANYKKVL